MNHVHPIMLFIICLLAGCGVGGGGGDDGGNGEVTPPESGGTFGSRAVPGYVIQVERLSAIQPGTSLTVQATLTADDGQPPPALVEAAIGSDGPSAWTAGIPVAGQAATWNWSVVLPADLTGQRVWVRVTDPDGNIAESGLDDFPLLP